MSDDLSIRTAQPGDIYVDARGTLWRITATVQEPTVFAEHVEGYLPNPVSNMNVGMVQFAPAALGGPQLERVRQSGGAGGLMWEGWRRIFRPGKPA